jgi:hypothetical protein
MQSALGQLFQVASALWALIIALTLYTVVMALHPRRWLCQMVNRLFAYIYICSVICFSIIKTTITYKLVIHMCVFSPRYFVFAYIYIHISYHRPVYSHCFVWGIASTCAILPFTTNSYGPAGPWCWIQLDPRPWGGIWMIASFFGRDI